MVSSHPDGSSCSRLSCIIGEQMQGWRQPLQRAGSFPIVSRPVELEHLSVCCEYAGASLIIAVMYEKALSAKLVTPLFNDCYLSSL
jgi:hypothetical protein